MFLREDVADRCLSPQQLQVIRCCQFFNPIHLESQVIPAGKLCDLPEVGQPSWREQECHFPEVRLETCWGDNLQEPGRTRASVPERAGVERLTLYRHFPNEYEL